jgi:DNA-binding NarL/FixJ family response regulator
MTKSVLIADDQEVIRRMLCSLFGSQSDFEVCGTAENGQEAVEIAQLFHPDLILLDLSMPVMNGIDTACELKRLTPTTAIIVFSEFSDVFSQREACKAGIAACISKSESVSVLLDRARAVLYPMQGECAAVENRIENCPPHPKFAKGLTR